MGLEKLQGQLSAFISTWTESAESSGTSAATATHAAEANKSHYITGFAVSSNDTGGVSGVVKIEILDDTTTIIAVRVLNQDIADSAPAGQAAIHSFSSPIQITEGEPCSIEVKGAAASSETYVNLWGFTS